MVDQIEVFYLLILFISIFYRWFDHFLTICILINAIAACYKDYKHTRMHTAQKPASYVFDKISRIITIIFIVEFVLKVIGLGFVTEPGTYLRDGWNKLDFVVVCTG